MLAHARIQLPIELFKKTFLRHGTGKPYSKFSKTLSINDVTILYTYAGRTDNQEILYSVWCYALH